MDKRYRLWSVGNHCTFNGVTSAKYGDRPTYEFAGIESRRNTDDIHLILVLERDTVSLDG